MLRHFSRTDCVLTLGKKLLSFSFTGQANRVLHLEASYSFEDTEDRAVLNGRFYLYLGCNGSLN